jgi:glycosyltransferase involved in cell wall biosynthesis
MKDHKFLVNLLRSFGVSSIHIHHVLGFHLDLQQLIHDVAVPFNFSAHDYYTICPQIKLITSEGCYCGEQGVEACQACLAARPSFGATDIQLWRTTYRWLYQEAQQVIYPSNDMATRMAAYHPVQPVIIPYEPQIWPTVEVAALAPGERLRIVMIGILSRPKGATLAAQVINAAALRNAEFEFYLIGFSEIPLAQHPAARISITGRYVDPDLPKLIAQIDPHVIWFPAQWPETYSYTLSEALRSGRPIVAPNVGAFRERLEEREWSWVIDWDRDVPSILELFAHIQSLLGASEEHIAILPDV